jgi:SAM-dependent methyltransferase
VKRSNGALRIFFYNWPTYVGTWAFALAMLLVALAEPRFKWPAVILDVILFAWSVVSLLVAHYIYDRSPLLGGNWISSLLPTSVQSWATIHAGLDAEVELDAVMPGRCVARLDVFDQSLMTAPSIKRARAYTTCASAAVSCSPTSLKLQDRTCDAVVVAFTAHEIRNGLARERFFDEIRRCVRPGGRVVLVEHLRDFMNFLAFGPGCLHFLSRGEWLRLAGNANLFVAKEKRITPWVMALSLERTS